MKIHVLFLLIILSAFSCGDGPQNDVETLELSLSISKKDIANGATSIPFHVMSNIAWVLESDVDWIEIEAQYRSGSGARSVAAGCKNNPGAAKRIGNIIVSPKDVGVSLPPAFIKITQSGESPKLSLDISRKEVGNGEVLIPFCITSNLAWTVESDVEWLEVGSEDRSGSGYKEIKVVCRKNPDTGKRVGNIIVSPQETGTGLAVRKIAVTQAYKQFSNPIEVFPDPWIVKHENFYYFCRAKNNTVILSRSPILSEINSDGISAWKCPLGQWNQGDLWAPELHYIDEGANTGWYVYYTAGKRPADNSFANQRPGVLKANSYDPLTAEWQDMGMLYCGFEYQEGIQATAENTFSSIDLSTFVLKGQRYAVWSGKYFNKGGSDTRPNDNAQCLYIAKMNNPWTMCSNAVKISKPDQPWEGIAASGGHSPIQEGPAFLRKGNNFFIVYSGDYSQSKYYCLGYIMMDIDSDPMNPESWTKCPASAVFHRNDNLPAGQIGVHGTGHCSFTVSPDGTEDWVVYHAKETSDVSWAQRHTFIQSFTWNENDTPNFGDPVGWGEMISVPSGE